MFQSAFGNKTGLYNIPEKNILLSTGPLESKVELLSSARLLSEKGYQLYATKGTHQFLKDNEVESIMLYWPGDKEQPNTFDYLKEKKIDLVINIPKNLSKNELDNDYVIRRSAVDYNIPLLTNARLAKAFITSFCKMSITDISIKSLEEY